MTRTWAALPRGNWGNDLGGIGNGILPVGVERDQ